MRWAVVPLLALTLAIPCAVPYARLSAPYLLLATRTLAALQPWKIQSVSVAANESGLGEELRLQGYVYRHAGDPVPAARVVDHLAVGEVIETPVVFWATIGLWPAPSLRRRLIALAAGLPVLLILIGTLNGLQLLDGMANASAILGHDEALTLWERASRFLEIGGVFVIDVCAALLVIACHPRLERAQRKRWPD
jgi:hypothetical protein